MKSEADDTHRLRFSGGPSSRPSWSAICRPSSGRCTPHWRSVRPLCWRTRWPTPLPASYATKMIPNNEQGADHHFRKLMEAIKLYASDEFPSQRPGTIDAVGAAEGAEKMAVIIQEVVGERHGYRLPQHLRSNPAVKLLSHVAAPSPRTGSSARLRLGEDYRRRGPCLSCHHRRPIRTPLCRFASATNDPRSRADAARVLKAVSIGWHASRYLIWVSLQHPEYFPKWTAQFGRGGQNGTQSYTALSKELRP